MRTINAKATIDIIDDGEISGAMPLFSWALVLLPALCALQVVAPLLVVVIAAACGQRRTG